MKNPTLGDLLSQRNNNFDFLRFILASLVILQHSFPVLHGRKGIWEEPLTFSGFYEEPLSVAVASFFIISGFLISLSWTNSKSVWEYLRKRLLRIYPGYVVVLFFAVFVAGPLGGAHLSAYFHDKWVYHYIYGNVFFQRNYIDGLPGAFVHLPYAEHPNISLWTIRVELMCYLMVVVAGLCGVFKRWSGGVIFALFLLSDAVYFYLSARHQALPNIGGADGLPRLTPYFLAGMFCYVMRDRIPFSHGLFAAAAAVEVLSVLLNITEITQPVCLAYILFYLAFHPGIKLHRFGKYGDFSYGIYLYGWPVQQILTQHFGKFLNPWTLFLSAFLLAWGMAFLSWHLIERPFLRLKSRSKQAPETVSHDAVVGVKEKEQEVKPA